VFISPHSAASKLTTNTGTLSGKQHSYDEQAIPFGEVNRVLEFSEVLIASIIRPMSIILGLYHHQGTHSREVQTSRHKS
jgi:hypothetical protein